MTPEAKHRKIVLLEKRERSYSQSKLWACWCDASKRLQNATIKAWTWSKYALSRALDREPGSFTSNSGRGITVQPICYTCCWIWKYHYKMLQNLPGLSQGDPIASWNPEKQSKWSIHPSWYNGLPWATWGCLCSRDRDLSFQGWQPTFKF